MGRLSFLKLLAVLSCCVVGSLVVGVAMAGMDIKYYSGGETYGPEGTGGKEGRGAGEKGGKTARNPVITLVGDVLLASGVGDAIARQGPDFPWKDTAGLIRESDLAIVNLECAVSDRGEPEPDKEYTFRADPGSLAGAVRAGVDVLTLANNHSLDFGPLAMLDTISRIKENGISWAGAGKNEAEAYSPAVLAAGGKKVAVLAFTRIIPRSGWIAGDGIPGVASGHNYRLIMDSVRAAEGLADMAVVSLHWGAEYGEFPDEKDIQLARALVDAGADIVVGHHPHVLQGVEIYKGKVIAYSLGNFIFTTSNSTVAREGAILRVAAGGNGEYRAWITPTYIHDGTTSILKGQDRKRVLERLNRLSSTLGASVDAEGEIRKIP